MRSGPPGSAGEAIGRLARPFAPPRPPRGPDTAAVPRRPASPRARRRPCFPRPGPISSTVKSHSSPWSKRKSIFLPSSGKAVPSLVRRTLHAFIGLAQVGEQPVALPGAVVVALEIAAEAEGADGGRGEVLEGPATRQASES